MAVLERSELEASPLADLHAIADQLGLDGFRRLRKAELIDAILGADGSIADDTDEPPADGSGRPPRRSSPILSPSARRLLAAAAAAAPRALARVAPRLRKSVVTRRSASGEGRRIGCG